MRIRKIAKKTITFVMSVRLSARTEQLCSHWADIHKIWHLNIFRKSVPKSIKLLKSDKNNAYFT